MPLENFGSILNFAEELESQDRQYYEAVAGNPACSDHKQMFEQFAANAKKNVATVQRTRRENVTEMILEPIKGFVRAPYCEVCQAAPDMTLRCAGCSQAVGRSSGALLQRGRFKNKGLAGSSARFKINR